MYFKKQSESTQISRVIQKWKKVGIPTSFFYNFGKSKVTFYTYLTSLVIGKSIIFKFNPKNFIEYQLFFLY